MRPALLLIVISSFATAQVITDGPTRLQAIATVFPGMSVTVDVAKRIDDSSTFRLENVSIPRPDAFKDEPVYEVIGAPAGDMEKCAAGDALRPPFSSPTREMRFKLLRVTPVDYVLVMQYRFPKSNPAMSCPTLARIAALTRNGRGFTKTDDRFLESTHHWTINVVQLLNLGDGLSDKVLIESDEGGGGVDQSDVIVFDIADHRFHALLMTTSFCYAAIDKENFATQTLDLARTCAAKGKRFCFTSTTYEGEDKWLLPPRIKHSCYKPGTGVENSTLKN